MSKATLAHSGKGHQTCRYPGFRCSPPPPAPAAFTLPQRSRASPRGIAKWRPCSPGLSSGLLPRLRARGSGGGKAQPGPSREPGAHPGAQRGGDRAGAAPQGPSARHRPTWRPWRPLSAGGQGGPGAGPEERIKRLARRRSVSCSGAAEVGTGTGGVVGSGIPLCPFSRVAVPLRAASGVSVPSPPLKQPPRSHPASGPIPKGVSPGSGRSSREGHTELPGRVRAFAGSGDDSFPVRATVLTLAVQARSCLMHQRSGRGSMLTVRSPRCSLSLVSRRARRSPRCLREPRDRSQAGHEGASPACAGRPRASARATR